LQSWYLGFALCNWDFHSSYLSLLKYSNTVGFYILLLYQTQSSTFNMAYQNHVIIIQLIINIADCGTIECVTSDKGVIVNPQVNIWNCGQVNTICGAVSDKTYMDADISSCFFVQ
jgi:hypothetical protein